MNPGSDQGTNEVHAKVEWGASRRWAEVALPLIAVVAIVHGAVGHLLALAEEPFLERLALVIIGTAQLFVLGVDLDDLVNWPLRIGAILAPAATATALWSLFAERLVDWSFRLRTRLSPPDTVVIGYGYLGELILERLSSNERASGKIVVIDITKKSLPPTHFVDSDKVRFRIGDATSAQALAAAGVARAKRVWIATGSDQKNMTVLDVVRSLPLEGGNRPQCLVDISKRESLRYAADFVDQQRSAALTNPWKIEFFNVERMVAREALRFAFSVDSALAERLWRSWSNGRGFHISIVGSGDIAEEILLHAIQYLVVGESPSVAPRITWMGQGVEARWFKLSKSYPALDPELRTVSGFESLLPLAGVQVHDLDELHLSAEYWRRAQSEQAFSVVMLVPQDERSQAQLLEQVNAQLTRCHGETNSSGTQVIVVVPPTMQFPTGVRKPDWVHVFESGAAILGPEDEYPGARCDEVARELHHHHNHSKDNKTPSTYAVDVINESWAVAKEFERWSSRCAADHLEIKSKLIACGFRPAADLVEELARVEQRRFVVERLLEGWLPPARGLTSAESTKSTREAFKHFRVHPDLVRWEQLAPESQRWNLEQIQKFSVGESSRDE